MSSEKSERASVSQCVAPRSSGFNPVENTAFEIMQAKHAVLLLPHMFEFGWPSII